MAVRDKPFYGSIAVTREVGITLRQLYYWVDVFHVVRPQVWRHGKRKFRHFTAEDVKKLKAAKRFVKRGYTLRAAVRAVTRT